MTERVVILLGPPGAGKGTQAQRLSQELALPHIATGDLFRDNRERDTELGRKAKEYMDSGRLVPDELVLDMLFDRLARPDAAQGYVLDGFPRTVPQGEALEARFGDQAVTRILIDVDDEPIVKRIVGRRICRANGHIFHVEFSPPATEGVCDTCGGELYQRADDREETVRERLRVYRAETQPVIDYYDGLGLLRRVDGAAQPDTVFDSLLTCLREFA